MKIQEGCSEAANQPSIDESGCFVPRVDENRKPQLGIVFNTLEEAHSFYHEYAKLGGFDIRSSSTKFKNGILTTKAYVCSKEGMSKSNSREVTRCGTMRTNWKALVRLKFDKERGVWKMHKFVKIHKHNFTSPRRRHLLRGNRKLSNAKKIMMKQFRDVNMPTNK